MSDSPVQKATGESAKGLVWMVAGAAALAVFVAPLITRFLPINATLALILAGAALAYFATGAIRKAGQGAAVFGVVSFVMPYLANLFGGMGARKNATGNGIVI